MNERGGSVLRLNGRWFETHRRHCIVSFSKTLNSLLSTWFNPGRNMTGKLLTGTQILGSYEFLPSLLFYRTDFCCSLIRVHYIEVAKMRLLIFISGVYFWWSFVYFCLGETIWLGRFIIYFVYITFSEMNMLFTQLLVSPLFVYTICLLVLL